jgi:hypothetical protein
MPSGPDGKVLSISGRVFLSSNDIIHWQPCTHAVAALCFLSLAGWSIGSVTCSWRSGPDGKVLPISGRLEIQLSDMFFV